MRGTWMPPQRLPAHSCATRTQWRLAQYGAWVMLMFRILASLKRLRGTRLDIFGYSEERRMERRLIGDYQATIDEVLATLSQDNHAKEREASLLASYRSPATQSVAAE